MGDEGRRSGRVRAANDNRDAEGPDPEVLSKVDAVALTLARISGRRMAREDFEKAMHAANDNAPPKSRTDANDLVLATATINSSVDLGVSR